MTFEAIVIGGGLQGCLIALALLELRPHARVLILEASDALCGNHTWSFHEGDLGPFMRALVAPAVEQTWSSYDVAFPTWQRRIARGYATVSASGLRRVTTERLERAPEASLRLQSEVVACTPTSVKLSSGQTLVADLVVDCRGPSAPKPSDAEAYQKFVGLELEVEPSSAFERPLLMDARVEQLDGFRFVYVLPLSATRVLVEDTYYSDSPLLDEETLRARVLEYSKASGLVVRSVVRSEKGVLPLPLRAPSLDAGLPLRAGYLGGWFHPTTGYSLPSAARLAEHLAHAWPELAEEPLARLAERQKTQARFCTLLNQLMFRAHAPQQRWRSLERFYRLPEGVIERFYGLRMTTTDKLRILVGRPPVGIQWGPALRQFTQLARSSWQG